MRKTQINLVVLLVFTLAASACKKTAEGASSVTLPDSTVVTSNDLKMRIAPNTTAVEIARLIRGEQVRIVQRSAEPVQIGKFNAHWYKVTNSSGLTGWVYGAHLAIEADEGDAQALAEQAEKKLRSMMLGRWEAAKITGALTANFVTLMPDGQIEFGSNRKATQYGKYTIAMVDGHAVVQITDIPKPMMTDLKAKLVGETLVFTATMNGNDYKLHLAEKDPVLFKDQDKQKAKEAAAASPQP
jgi:SH3-like domain-containing protein